MVTQISLRMLMWDIWKHGYKSNSVLSAISYILTTFYNYILENHTQMLNFPMVMWTMETIVQLYG